MRRSLVLTVIGLMASTQLALADAVGDQVKQLSNSSYKNRLSAALALAKSSDPRAIEALIKALATDDEAALRRVCIIALTTQAPNLKEALVEKVRVALTSAAKKDEDSKVRVAAAEGVKGLPQKGKVTSKAPPVFVQVEKIADSSKKTKPEVVDRISKNLRRAVEDIGLATQWPGGTPSKSDLVSNSSKAFIVVATVKKIEAKKKGKGMEVSCAVTIRVSPWTGRDGNETWEANRSASANGTAKTTTSTDQSDIMDGGNDCVDLLADDLARRQVLPFLKKIASL